MKRKLFPMNLLTAARARASAQTLVVGAVVMSLSGCIIHAGEHHGHADSERHESSQSLSMSADSVMDLYVDSGAGSVEIKGVKGATSITVNADIVSQYADGSDVIFTLERDGDRAKLVGKRNTDVGFSYGERYSRVDMTVTVPAQLALNIDDGSGSITVKDIANDVRIDDGSGSLLVKNVLGNLDIKDGSGWIEVSHIDGKVVIDDNSGSLSVQQVTGTVNIDDGSGGIDVQDVTNDVVISDGSGGISVARVANLNIVDAGSGGVSVVDVERDVSADADWD